MTLKGWFILMVIVGLVNLLGLVFIWSDLHDRADDVKSKIDNRFNEVQFRMECS